MGKKGSRTESAPVAGRVLWHWLIVKDTVSEIEILTLDMGGYPRTLPVFGSEDTALRMLPATGGWRVRKTGGGKLVSVLCGPCSDASWVALDPSPRLIDSGMVELVSENTDAFLDLLLGSRRAWLHDSPGDRQAGVPPELEISRLRAR
jgi:hypothetical protein